MLLAEPYISTYGPVETGMNDQEPSIPELDEAMYAYSQADYQESIRLLEQILKAQPDQFEALTALSMAYCRLERFEEATRLGHQAESMRPNDPLVHTNLSLFYVKQGNKEKAEHHGLQAKIASWKTDMNPTAKSTESENDSSIPMQKLKPETYKTPSKFPDMPWKKNT